MYHLFISIFVLSITFSVDSDKAVIQLEQALEMAENEEKNVMIVFSGSDWCKPCIVLKKEILTQPKFEAYVSENLVMFYLDFPYGKKNKLSKEQQKYNDEMAEKYNPKGQFPLVLIMNKDKEILGELKYSKGLKVDQFLIALDKLIVKG